MNLTPYRGTGTIMTNSSLILTETSHGSQRYFNLRAVSIDVSFELSKIFISFPFMEDNKCESFILQLFINTSSTFELNRFCDWIATLLVHSHLKLNGLETRSYYPFTLKSSSSYEENKSKSELLIESSVEFNADFNNNSWVISYAKLKINGILELVDVKNQTVREYDLQTVKTSNINEDLISLLSQQHVINVIIQDKLSNSMKIFKIKLKNKQEHSKWLYSLKSVSRPHIFSTATGSLLTSIRISKVLNLSIIKAKLDSSFVLKHLDEDYGAFINISFGNFQAKTCITKLVRLPFWLDDFWFNNLPQNLIPELSLELWIVNHKTDQIEFSGYLTLDEKSVLKNNGLETWYKIKAANPDHNEIGQINVRVSVNETKVAHTNHYQVVSDAFDQLSLDIKYLFAFDDNETNNIGLTTINDLLLKLMIAHSDSLLASSWISALITQEIEKVKDFIIKKHGKSCLYEGCSKKQKEFRTNLNNSLFRGNSLLTRALEKYMRIIGTEHLEATVGTFVREFISQSPNLEINPSRIMDENDPELIAESHQKALLDNTTKIWNLIQNSVDELPMALKQVFSHLSDELETKLHQSSLSIQSYVGGFLFLRFFCPVLLNPKTLCTSFGNDTCDTNIQRSLTLIAKMLMCFVNHSRFGLKEPWMIPMNSFIDNHNHELSAYFDKVTLKLDKPKQTNFSRVALAIDTFAEREFFFSVNKKIGNTPLREVFNNKFMIDETAAYAQLVDAWKTYLNPNKANFFKKLAAATDHVEDDPHSVLAKFERFYEACEKAWTTSSQIINNLINHADQFDPTATESYARHMDLEWTASSINNNGKLEACVQFHRQPYIKPTLSDWHTKPKEVYKGDHDESSIIIKSLATDTTTLLKPGFNCARTTEYVTSTPAILENVQDDYDTVTDKSFRFTNERDDSKSVHSAFSSTVMVNTSQSLVSNDTDFVLETDNGKRAVEASSIACGSSISRDTKDAITFENFSVSALSDLTKVEVSNFKEERPRTLCSMSEKFLVDSPKLLPS